MDGVSRALELLLEALDRHGDSVADSGAAAMRRGDLDAADVAMHRLRTVRAVREDVHTLRRQWPPAIAGASAAHSQPSRRTRSQQREQAQSASHPDGRSAQVQASPEVLVFSVNTKGVTAHGYPAANGFAVMAGSSAVTTMVPSADQSLVECQSELLARRVLIRDGSQLRFAEEYTFSSPSQAASVVMGRNANGRIEWKDDRGRTLREVQEASAPGGLISPGISSAQTDRGSWSARNGQRGEVRCYEDLVAFVQERMRMSHVYQPVMLMALLNHGGVQSSADIARAIQAHLNDRVGDENRLAYYRRKVSQMVGKVLADNGAVIQDCGMWVLVAFESLTPEQVNHVSGMLVARLTAWAERQGRRARSRTSAQWRVSSQGSSRT